MTVAERSSLSGTTRAELVRLLGDKVWFDDPLARHCSLGIGGPADAFCVAGSPEVLRRLLSLFAAQRVRWLMVGRGTNLVPADLGFRGAVVKLEGEFNRVVIEGQHLIAGAAVGLSRLVEQAQLRDLGGLEFTTGIPGCVGGSLPGNAGTASESLGDRVDEVTVLKPDGALQVLGSADLSFSYRGSNLQALGGVVTAARFRLEPTPRAQVVANVRGHTEKRKDQPLTLPNVGCIFKNPLGRSAGQLIEQAGFKGARAGQVEVSSKHANFMVNLGGATSAEVRALIARVREGVQASTSVSLEAEVIVLDECGGRVDA